nr:hypothetical protein [Fusobacterium nucleatum]
MMNKFYGVIDKIMLKTRDNTFTFNEEENVYMRHLSIWNKETEVHFWGVINRDYEKNFEKKLNWLEENRLSIIDKFIEEDDVFNSINQMIVGKELEISNQKILDKITEEDFKNSFYIKLVNFEFLENSITIDLYMGTEPDYLMGHFVNIKITNDFNIELHYTYILPSLINQAIQRNLKKPWKKEDKILIFPYVRKY